MKGLFFTERYGEQAVSLHEKKHKALCKKYEPYISKYMARILKYMACIFCHYECLMHSNLPKVFFRH